jgi:hypothetical protein
MFKFRRFCVRLMKCCFVSSENTPSDMDLDQKTVGMKDHSIQKHINTTTSEVSKLTLIILDTVHMIVGAEYEITPQGLKSSKRSLKDGCVYAGSVERQGRVVLNDIILPEREKGVGKRHFMIQYNRGKE